MLKSGDLLHNAKRYIFIYEQRTDLCHEHSPRRYFHVVTEFKVLKEGDCLRHAYVTIHFKAHISNRIPWIDVSNDIFCDDVQAWSLK